jgi:hypothetical protein
MSPEYRSYLAANILSEERVVRCSFLYCRHDCTNAIPDHLSTAQQGFESPREYSKAVCESPHGSYGIVLTYRGCFLSFTDNRM